MGRSLDLLTEACAPLDHTQRRMFGGHAFFAPNGGMFAGIVTDDAITFKLVRGPLRDALISLGGKPWVYNEKMTMQEWIVIPDGFYDDLDAMTEWAAKAHAAAPAKKLKISPTKTAAAKKPVARAKPAKKKTRR
jgi:TfoX/Sxy family transcriptional regulator of competence genes